MVKNLRTKLVKDLFVFDESSCILEACELIPGETHWREIADYSSILRGNTCTLSAVAAADTIYALTWRKLVYCIRPYEENPMWKQLMFNTLEGHGPCPPVAAIGDCIYACGGGWKESEVCYVDGWQMYKFSAKCEKFDPRNGGWSYIADLHTPRRLNTVVEAVGNLYCIGGLGEKDSSDVESESDEETEYGDDDWKEGKELALVERYEKSTDEWVEVAPMKTPRVAPAAVAHKGKIFVLGGGYQYGSMKSVDFYDIRTNTWVEMKQTMRRTRIKFTAFVMRKHLYAVGGDRDSTAEKIGLEDNSEPWRVVKSLLDGKDINGMGTVVVKRPKDGAEF